ncbi:MAG: class I SAM-dependent methyltransferase [Moheibacter sp.]
MITITDNDIRDFWNENADTWSLLAKAGGDIYRDHLNTPEFIKELPAINGLVGLDVGCGDGHNTEILSSMGAFMTGIDISEKFTNIALKNSKTNIKYLTSNAIKTPFADNYFDFVTGFMSFMDVLDIKSLFVEINRILKPNGFIQFSISHPCFNPINRKNLKDKDGKVYAVELSDYFKIDNVIIENWVFDNAEAFSSKKLNGFKIPRITRTLNTWFNAISEGGFYIEMLHEPIPLSSDIEKCPKLHNATVVAYFLHLRCRKLQTNEKN